MPKRLAFLCILTLLTCVDARTKNVNDFLNFFGGVIQQSVTQPATAQTAPLQGSEPLAPVFLRLFASG